MTSQLNFAPCRSVNGLHDILLVLTISMSQQIRTHHLCRDGIRDRRRPHWLRARRAAIKMVHQCLLCRRGSLFLLQASAPAQATYRVWRPPCHTTSAGWLLQPTLSDLSERLCFCSLNLNPIIYGFMPIRCVRRTCRSRVPDPGNKNRSLRYCRLRTLLSTFSRG